MTIALPTLPTALRSHRHEPERPLDGHGRNSHRATGSSRPHGRLIGRGNQRQLSSMANAQDERTKGTISVLDQVSPARIPRKRIALLWEALYSPGEVPADQ